MKRKAAKPKRLRRPAGELVADGMARHERGDAAAAEELYREALRQKPDHDRALALLAMILTERGEGAEAAALLGRAIAIAPDAAWYHLSLGHAQAAAGRDAEAVAAMAQAAALDPEAAVPRYDLARHHLRHGRPDAALPVLREVLACEPGHPRARFLIASLTGGHVDAPPADYVTELFDSYAPTFEAHLVDELAYQAPAQLARLLPAPARAWRVVDLGCGSGLGGIAVRDHARHLVGSDLSPKMIELARARGVYDELHAEDLTATLARTTGADLVLAADVFIYVGALDDAFRRTAAALGPGGRFAFSTEACDAGFRLLPTRRYAHARGYVSELAARHGFAIDRADDTVLRMEHGAPISGVLYLLRRD
jgi:predicted TPR repeat methyltransferase